jgi:hypothetical protein
MNIFNILYKLYLWLIVFMLFIILSGLFLKIDEIINR